MTGAVDTNSKSDEFTLLPTSRYLPMEETVRKYAKGEDHRDVTAKKYADKVVDDIILKGFKSNGFSGSVVRLVRHIVPFTPAWLYVSFFYFLMNQCYH